MREFMLTGNTTDSVAEISLDILQMWRFKCIGPKFFLAQLEVCLEHSGRIIIPTGIMGMHHDKEVGKWSPTLCIYFMQIMLTECVWCTRHSVLYAKWRVITLKKLVMSSSLPTHHSLLHVLQNLSAIWYQFSCLFLSLALN